MLAIFQNRIYSL